MLGARPKSAAAEGKSGKVTPPTPKGGRASKPSPAKLANGTPPQAPRTADRSPRSADKPPSGERRAPKVFDRLSTPPAEKQSSVVKLSQELQAQLAAVQEELVKAKEQLVEKEIWAHWAKLKTGFTNQTRPGGGRGHGTERACLFDFDHGARPWPPTATGSCAGDPACHPGHCQSPEA